MTAWKLFRLQFGRNPVHFGELGIGMEETSDRIHSDTLFSAWVSAYARLFGKDAVEEILKQFTTEAEPLFRLSSTFIYQQIKGKTIYYLPRPFKRPFNYQESKNELDFAKEYKKLNYLPLEVWQRWYQGEGWKNGDAQELEAKAKKGDKVDGELTKAGTFDYGEAIKKGKVSKIAVDRITRATNIYHTNFVYFQEDAGLYFLVEFSNPELENRFLTVLNFLGEEGIGGERSSGAGQFKVKVEPSELTPEWEKMVNFDKGKGNKDRIFHSLISLFWENPLASNLLDQKGKLKEESSYELLRRGGWISSSPSGSQRRRKSVQMFAEGSIFPVKPMGKLADVTPEGFTTHHVYRSGISLSLPIKV